MVERLTIANGGEFGGCLPVFQLLPHRPFRRRSWRPREGARSFSPPGSQKGQCRWRLEQRAQFVARKRMDQGTADQPAAVLLANNTHDARQGDMEGGFRGMRQLHGQDHSQLEAAAEEQTEALL